jgi:regulator of sigma E protease
LTFVVFLLALGGMIFVHEFGHFLAARLFKIEVEEFGFGLPSYRLITLFRWRGTDFTLHALPLGGFVRPKGENDPNVAGGLAAAKPWSRLAVLFAGPLMNLLTAVAVFATLIGMQGMPIAGPVRIDEVLPNSPGAQAGLQRGDLIRSIDGAQVSEVGSAISLIRSHLDQPVVVEILRGSEELLVEAVPSSSRSTQEGALGVSLTSQTRPATAGEMLSGGVVITGLQAATILYLPVALIQGIISPGEARVVGFKGIYDMFGVALREDVQTRQPTAGGARRGTPTNWTLNLIALLSVSLGVMNLLPIPALDGGRILFTLPELLFRRRIPPERENLINGIAMMLLIILLLFVNLMDFINPVEIPIP